MNNILSISAFCALFLFISCEKTQDENDLNNASAVAAAQRLPVLLTQFADTYESTGTRAAFIGQQLAVTYANNNNWNLTRWYSNVSSANWPWQCWYVNAAVNITPLISAAEKVEAWHYVGAAKIIKAWGFGTLSDCYGMLPYNQVENSTTITPRIDDGAHVQEQVLKLLDEAIADLQQSQGTLAPPLSKGDILNKGSVENWVRLAYGLKARYLNHLSKKGNYDMAAVLDAASKGPQETAQSSVMQYADDVEALQYVNTGTNARVTKLYLDYLTNNYTDAPTGASNMQDPRLDSLVPSTADKAGNLIRTKGVDMASDLPKSGPAATDSQYVTMRRTEAGERLQSTGTFYTGRGAKGLLFTHAEIKFIQAEVFMRQNKTTEALAAYKAGIAAHMALIGIKADTVHKFLESSSVVQTAGALTMSHIMIQKYIALSYSPELWVDLRRMDFCTDEKGNYNEVKGVYKGFKRPSHVFAEAYPGKTDWPRRFAVASYEINYNRQQVLAANPDAARPVYLNQKVWWDQP